MADMNAGRGVRVGVGCGVAVAMAAGLAMWRLPAVQAQDAGPNYQLAAQVGDLVDPPSRVARVSVLYGNVSVEPGTMNEFSAAEVNYTMTTGDRIYADRGANAEIQTGQLAVRMGQQTDLTVTAMTDTLAQLGLAQGSVHLRSYSLEQGETVELDTPNVAVTVLQPGDVRVDVDPNSDTTIVWLLAGEVEVDGNGVQQVMQPGDRVKLSGSNPVYAQWMKAARTDGLDRFSADRDGLFETALESENDYVNPGTIGAEDLQGNGEWQSDADYGAVWYPTTVAVGWAPYTCGHWGWVAPWGWTWIGCESWGFAPFHYGRWNHFGNRWGWIPGPRTVRPIYSPGLVVFVGGPRQGGGGVTAWFPLGPREPYQPWYSASPRYMNRVNVSNIANRNTAEVWNVYNSRSTVNMYNANNMRRVYANRQLGTVAVSQETFAQGRPVQGSMMRVDPRQMAGAPIWQRPLITPQRPAMAQGGPRAVPQQMQRPVLATRGDRGMHIGAPGNGSPESGGPGNGGRNGTYAGSGGGNAGQRPPNGGQQGSGQQGGGQPSAGSTSAGPAAPVQRGPAITGRPMPTPGGTEEGYTERGGYQNRNGQNGGGQNGSGNGSGTQPGARGPGQAPVQVQGNGQIVGPRPSASPIQIQQPQPRVTGQEGTTVQPAPNSGQPGVNPAPGGRVQGGPRYGMPEGQPDQPRLPRGSSNDYELRNNPPPRPSGSDQQQRTLPTPDPVRPQPPQRQIPPAPQSQPVAPPPQREAPRAVAPPPQRSAPPPPPPSAPQVQQQIPQVRSAPAAVGSTLGIGKR